MPSVEPIGISRILALHYYVHDLERSRRFYTKKFDFAEIAASSKELEGKGKQRSVLFQAGNCNILISEPIGEGGRAWRYLRRHPDGVGTVVFEVSDIERTFNLLDGRSGTIIDEIKTYQENGGTFRSFSITTPYGGSTFRFVQKKNYPYAFPGMVHHKPVQGGQNSFGFLEFDHITSNFETMAPALLWLEHVLGFEHYWDIEFHTADHDATSSEGSGLRSKVMWDPHSGVKFAHNEPRRPSFKQSQINLFAEDNRGDGIQHVALSVKDIVGATRGLRARNVTFMSTPATYYEMLPERLKQIGVQFIDEDIKTLRELEILVDGKEKHQYLLQIFLQDSASTHHDREAGPFFFEIVQRKGDGGFGGGNFLALFESIERKQRTEGRV